MLEVLLAQEEPVSSAQKRAFAQDTVEIFRDVLGTPDGRLRLFFNIIAWEDSIPALLETDAEKEES
jgi:hypothetical protein